MFNLILISALRVTLGWLVCNATLSVHPLYAQTFPARPVTIIAPFSPAGPVDAISRLVGRSLAGKWKQPVIVENRPGAGTIIGTQLAAKSSGDGYTLLMTSLAYTTNQILVKNLPYDDDALEPLTLVAVAPNVLYVGSKVRATNVKEFVAIAKNKPGTMTFASSGNGSSLHMAAELFASETGISFIHVPYKGAGPAIVDMLGGQVEAIFDTTVQSIDYAKNGKFKALGVAATERFALLPNVPTFIEQGYPGVQSSTWVGFLVPKGTPSNIRSKLLGDIQAALKSDEVQNGIRALGFQPKSMNQVEFSTYLDSEREHWSELIRKRGITLK